MLHKLLKNMNILYFGSSGLLSTKPLKALLDNGFKVCAVVFDETENAAQQLGNIAIVNTQTDSIVSLAWAHQIPTLRLGNAFNDSLLALQNYQPDIILVSCYARILPSSVTSLAKLGCFNIHPSLLPAYRGPEPIFWQLKFGEQEMGVSIHKLTETIDGGDILKQQPLTLRNGLTRLEIERFFANAAADLLLEVLGKLEHYLNLAVNQNNTLLKKSAAYRSFAQADDFNLSNHWAAQRLYNFVCAYAHSNRYFNCSINGEIFRITEALWFDITSYMDEPYNIEKDKVTFNCSSGLIQCCLSKYHL